MFAGSYARSHSRFRHSQGTTQFAALTQEFRNPSAAQQRANHQAQYQYAHEHDSKRCRELTERKLDLDRPCIQSTEEQRRKCDEYDE